MTCGSSRWRSTWSGLATAVLVYAVLVRFGSRMWLAALASIPVLFDPLQLVLEQYVLADVWTAFLVLAALVILVWRREEGNAWRRDKGSEPRLEGPQKTSQEGMAGFRRPPAGCSSGWP